MKIKRILFLLVCGLFLAGCQQGPDSCPSYNWINLDGAESYAENDQLPFQFPMANAESYTFPIMTNFAVCGQDTKTRRECHAAEDYYNPPGTPVYAMADGEVSFSGPMGGYGWLVIVAHPQHNLYSLYGHLSPSRWYAEPGPVEKGELIDYLGDSNENGGSDENPLVPHLHFGVRAGQPSDYGGSGEWRWMAGWIAACPKDLGWMQPSAVIDGQTIPSGGFAPPTGKFFSIWWFTIVFGGTYFIGFVFLLIYAIKKDKPQALAAFGLLYLTAGWMFASKHFILSKIMLGLAVISIGIGFYRAWKRGRPKQTAVRA